MPHDYKKQGKKNRAAGKRFEFKVRGDLEKQGWIVSKWQNVIEWDEDNINRPTEFRTGKLIPCKPKFNPFTKSIIMMSGGFPDFIAMKREGKLYQVIGVESKMDGTLSQKEKEMADWLLQDKVFSRILIARKGKKRGTIEYKEKELSNIYK